MEKSMKAIKIFAILMVGLISSCSTLKDKTIQISPGDTKEKVVDILGTPDDRQFKSSQEAWQYGTVVAIGICEYTIVWFNKGVVSGLNSYRNNSVAGCRVGIQPVRWESAPDTVIEVRNR
jgi:hypothetical protein